ncbi:hypothetical protein KI387_022640 [Taxus chinensis]|uniref:Uncharacterized protein n=1 Tax=Taxus chinensis TaxID=29808 RepID=A0AA38L609_TAXCH|nr:hypothetical protein KI387_022640 [Taxus chinensis]
MLLCINPCVSRIVLLRVDSFSSSSEEKVEDFYTLYHDHKDPKLTQEPPSALITNNLQFTEDSVICLPVVGIEFCSSLLAMWTVRKKPLVFSGGGFIVTNSCTGQIIFRVDGRGSSLKHRVILMDAVGKPLLSLHRKVLSVCNRWDGFCGEKCDGQKPIFSVRKSLIFNKNEVAEVFVGSKAKKKRPDYKVEGTYRERYCRIYSGSNTIVAEVKRKFGTCNVMLSKDVFSVVVNAGSDQAFIMGLIVILDQMTGENDSF